MVVRLVVEAIFALVSGGWGARHVGPAICARCHIGAVDMITLAGFMVGTTFWAAAAAAIKTAVAFAPVLINAILQQITGVRA